MSPDGKGLTSDVDAEGRFEWRGKRYVLVRDTSYIENAILSGEAIRVDVGDELLVWAVPE